jgi:exonuclease SbcD
MPERSFRFLHTGDWHLELPAHGLAEAPEHLRSLLVELPYRAAEKVIDAALAERVDFVVLAGDLLDVALAGPHGPLFLNEQFSRLERRGIPVYWASSRLDAPERWPLGCRLPSNVHRLVRHRQETHVFERDGEPLAWLTVLPHAEMERPRLRGVPLEREELRHVVVTHGEFTLDELPDRVDYFALGGRHARTTLRDADDVAHDPGAPQGRSFAEPGMHGCTLVQVAPFAPPRVSFVPTSVLLWHEESLEIKEETTRERLERLLRERTAALSVAHPECDQWIRWTVRGTGPLLRRLRSGKLASDMVGTLRQQFGQTRPAVWTESLHVRAADTIGATIDEDTLLGEYLRQLRSRRFDAGAPLDLRPYLSEHLDAEPLREAAMIEEYSARTALLDEAAALGVDLLGQAEESP